MKRKSNSNTVTFSKWSRHPFAVMNSLHKVIKIAVVCLSYSMLTQPGKLYAQADTTEVIHHLQEVVISAQRAPAVYSNIARIVQVIPRSEIANAPVLSLNELLDYVPGVDIRQRGTNGIQADISIQGGSFDQSLILLNGLNISDPQTGHHNLNLPLDIECTDKVEILKGPGSRIFGANAFTGAINLLSGLDTTNHLKASTTFGSYGLYKLLLANNLHSKHFNNFISVSQSASDGYISNTDYNLMNVYYHGTAFMGQSKLHVLWGYSEKQFGANDFYTPVYPQQRENTNTWLSAIKFETGKKIKITPSLYWRRNYDHFKTFVTDKYYHNYHYSDVLGANINATLDDRIGKFSIGADYRKEMIHSTVLGKTDPDPVKIKGTNLYYTKKDSRDNISLYLEQNFRKENLNLSAGNMVNLNSKLNGPEFYPGLDLSYRMIQNWWLYSSVNRSLRLPTYTDLYYQGTSNVGNPDLKPEKAWTLEAGIKKNLQGIDLNISWFMRWGRNIIDWVREADTVKWHTENLTNLNTTGVELNARFKLNELITPDFFVHEINISYTYTHVDMVQSAFQSHYALDNLKHRFLLGIRHSMVGKLEANWQLTYMDRNGDYTDYDSSTKKSTLKPYPTFWLLDGRISYPFPKVKVFAEATNIFGTRYFDFSSVVQPGRWFKIGATLDLPY